MSTTPFIDFIVSVTLTQQRPGGFNLQNKLYHITAVSREEAYGKVLPQLSHDFPEHGLHTICSYDLSTLPRTAGDERRHVICLCPDCTKPAPQQGPIAWTATRLWNRKDTWTCPADIEKDLLEGGASPAQQQEKGMSEFLVDLHRSRTKYPKNGRMFDGLMGEVDELRRAYAGDGDMRAEAFDVAVCAFRIATEGDAGGNTALEPAQQQEPVAWPVGSAELHISLLNMGKAMAKERSREIGDAWNQLADLLALLAKLRTSRPAQRQEPVAWCPDVCPITGLPFFMWIEHHETGQMVPTYGGPYDSYTIPVRDKDGSYYRERYDHDRGGWLTDEVEDVGVQIVSDQAYVSDEPPASKPWVGLTEEERNNIVNAVYDDHYNRRVSDTDLEIAKAVEAKLRELNEHKEKNA